MANFSRNASFYKPKKATSLNQKHLVVRVEALDNLGAGIAYSDLEYAHQTKKTPIFIDGALPDETVRIQLTEQKAKYARAKLIAVDKPSEIRIKPNCPHFAECGGCQLQHMPHQAQVAYKSETLLNLFKKISPQAQASSELAAPVISPEFGYRRRARISLMYDQKKQALAFGFRQSGSHQITQVKQCPVLVPQLDALLPELRILLENFDKPRTLGHLELVYDGEQVAVLLRHTQALTESAKESLVSFANQNQLALFLQPAPETIEQITGKPLSYSETDAKIDFLPTDFIQVNETVNQKMVAQAIEWLEIKPTDSVLDLFCGLGNFSLAIAKKAQSVVGVEGIEAMVLRAQINAKHNGLDNIRFYQANLEESQTDAAWAKQRFDKVILDPARAGASGVLAQLTEFSPSRLVYISCNPATLARDSQQLAELGYELKQLGMLDMFPQTRHLESMALFVKSNKPVLRSSQHKTAVTKTAMSKTAGMSKTAAKKRQGTKRPAPKRLKI